MTSVSGGDGNLIPIIGIAVGATVGGLILIAIIVVIVILLQKWFDCFFVNCRRLCFCELDVFCADSINDLFFKERSSANEIVDRNQPTVTIFTAR